MSPEDKELRSRQIEALHESILHWERMQSGDLKFKGEAPIQSHCACCIAFRVDSRPKPPVCLGCPVMEDTRQDFCEGSPYEAAAEAWDDYGADSSEFQVAAQEEILYLRRLLSDLEFKREHFNNAPSPCAK